jgi:hypothetical protein
MADGTREYSLLGRDGEQAMVTGLAGAKWYQTDIPRKQLTELMQRRDGRRVAVSILAGGAGLPCLWRSLWLGDGFTLA